MKNSLRIHKWTHNEFNIFILGVLTHPRNIETRLVGTKDEDDDHWWRRCIAVSAAMMRPAKYRLRRGR